MIIITYIYRVKVNEKEVNKLQNRHLCCCIRSLYRGSTQRLCMITDIFFLKWEALICIQIYVYADDTQVFRNSVFMQQYSSWINVMASPQKCHVTQRRYLGRRSLHLLDQNSTEGSWNRQSAVMQKSRLSSMAFKKQWYRSLSQKWRKAGESCYFLPH